MVKKFDINLIQGAEYSLDVSTTTTSGTPVDLTGFSARMQARPDIDSPITYINLATNSGIKMPEPTTSGNIQIVLTSTETSAINIVSGVYDLELVASGGQVTRLLQGRVLLDREVTR